MASIQQQQQQQLNTNIPPPNVGSSPGAKPLMSLMSINIQGQQQTPIRANLPNQPGFANSPAPLMSLPPRLGNCKIRIVFSYYSICISARYSRWFIEISSRDFKMS